MGGPGIGTSLREFAQDEGLLSAIEKAEDFRDCLEEMREIGTEEQQRWCTCLLTPIGLFLQANVIEDKSKDNKTDITDNIKAKAYNEGWRAGYDDVEPENPYVERSTEHYEWEKGYTDGWWND